MTEIKRDINPRRAATALRLISRIPGEVTMRDGSKLTIGEIAAAVIVRDAREVGGPDTTMMSMAIAYLEEDATLEVRHLGGELRQVLGYEVLRGGE